MNLELVIIGTELLLGFTVDTNGGELGRTLAEAGIRVVRRTVIADRAADIRGAVSEGLARTGAVIVTGGLGPTRDDITKETVAALYGTPIEFDEGLWQALVERYRRVGREPVESNRTQAEVPRGATVLPNRWGSAPGLWLERNDLGLVIMLPGVPLELRMLLQHEVMPRLTARPTGRVIRSRMLRTCGIAESVLAERLGEIERDVAPLTLAYLPHVAGVDVRLTAWDADAEEADGLLEHAAATIRDRAGGHVYGEDDADLAALVLEMARQQGVRLAVAESCTGGLIGARLTEIPGSSDVFDGGVIAYADEVKSGLLGVDAGLIGRHGAVSEEVAAAMAAGACARLGAGLSVAVTGIAGPAGGTPEKPVGTVCFGTAMSGEVRAARTIFFGTRAEVRARAAQWALWLLYGRLRESGPVRT